ncbi:MAG: hypothetical protein INR64_19930 [Caulobacteraceae bacterium]|nr:hypothetical protein [Caulobacter sp.]
MFVEGGGGWQPSPWRPPQRPRRMTKREESVILWLVAVNLLLLVVAPIGGATIVEAVIAAFAGR